MREPPLFFYETGRLRPRHWNIIIYDMSSTPSLDQAHSSIAPIGSSSPFYISSTSLLTLASYMDALTLLDAFRENEVVTTATPSRTLVDRTQKGPRVGGST